MRRIILGICLFMLPLFMLPMVFRYNNHKEYASVFTFTEYIGNYDKTSELQQQLEQEKYYIRTVWKDGYQFGDILDNIGSYLKIAIFTIGIPFDFVIYLVNFIPFYANV